MDQPSDESAESLRPVPHVSSRAEHLRSKGGESLPLRSSAAPNSPAENVSLFHEGGEFSLIQMLSILLKHRRVILAMAFGLALIVVAHSLLQPRKYTAHASFVPQEAEGSRLGGAAALAGQFGISLPVDEAGRSPQFYADLLKSREVLSRILEDTFTVSEAGWSDAGQVSATLPDLLEIEEENEALRRAQGIRWLQNEVVRPSTNRETGLVEVEVTTRWPAASRQISYRLLELLNEFNLQRRQSQAIAERTFVEERLDAAQEELLEAEERLKLFLENNRSFQNAPGLEFERDRLQRQVARRQEIVTSLAQSSEEARISEVRNTPVITVVERPSVPPEGDPRGTAVKATLGLLVGGMLGIFFAFGREIVWRARENGGEEYVELHLIWQQALDDIREPVRRLVGKR